MIKKILAFTASHMQKTWYPIFIATIIGLDIFILAVPNDALLISAVLAQPKRWLRIAIYVSIGSIIGVALFSGILLQYPDLIRATFPGVFESSVWAQTSVFLQNYGVFALFFGAVGPLPQQPFVVVAALSGVNFSTIIFSVLAGRLLKYIFLAWVASHSPKLLAKLTRKKTIQVSGVE
jgi:membrane protein YqaA with SNARE-associated domain